MKKLIAMTLSAVMALSMSAVAFAAEPSKNVIDVRKEVAYKAENATVNDKANTELWLQVGATGQIDVTVPLVMVFKTNIDGGVADTANNYKITNNSSADLAVTGIKTTVEANGLKNPMTLDAYATSALDRDHYKAQLSVADKGTWDLATTEHNKAANEGGLFNVVKDGSTPVKVDMATGKLSFVTKPDAENNEFGVKLLNVNYTVAINTQNAIGDVITK